MLFVKIVAGPSLNSERYPPWYLRRLGPDPDAFRPPELFCRGSVRSANERCVRAFRADGRGRSVVLRKRRPELDWIRALRWRANSRDSDGQRPPHSLKPPSYPVPRVLSTANRIVMQRASRRVAFGAERSRGMPRNCFRKALHPGRCRRKSTRSLPAAARKLSAIRRLSTVVHAILVYARLVDGSNKFSQCLSEVARSWVSGKSTTRSTDKH